MTIVGVTSFTTWFYYEINPYSYKIIWGMSRLTFGTTYWEKITLS